MTAFSDSTRTYEPGLPPMAINVPFVLMHWPHVLVSDDALPVRESKRGWRIPRRFARVS